jgi:signal transduction histidine kinase
MARINDENLSRARNRLQASQNVLHNFLLQMMAFTVGLGIIVAILTTRRVALLERKHEEQTKQIEQTQNNLRRLSRRLVQAQELERQALSRELHDEVGQMMTALGMELGHLETLRNGSIEAFRTRIEDAKRLNADAMRAIRDLAMGLRPSMLDDIGIEAACNGRDANSPGTRACRRQSGFTVHSTTSMIHSVPASTASSRKH